MAEGKLNTTLANVIKSELKSKGHEVRTTEIINGMLLRLMDKDFTVHGFRSTFRDWAGEAAAFLVGLLNRVRLLGKRIKNIWEFQNLKAPGASCFPVCGNMP